jgi:hypothetical protein
LNRLKTKVTDFSNFLRGGTKESSQPPVERAQSHQIPKLPDHLPASGGARSRAKSSVAGQQKDKISDSVRYLGGEDLACVPFYKEDRLNLRIGESNHKGHEFVRETAAAIKSMPKPTMTCDEIAHQLNRTASRMPRGCKWNGTLVYHFTRHYMEILPAFFTENIPKVSTKSHWVT